MLSLAPTGAALASGSFGSATTNERPIAEYAVRPSALNMIQEFLYRGEKRKAYHYALDEKLWAHAMVIAGSIDKEAFKEVVNEFVRAELGTKTGPAQFSGRPQPLVMNGYESLRLAYSLYSGQSSSAGMWLNNCEWCPDLTDWQSSKFIINGAVPDEWNDHNAPTSNTDEPLDTAYAKLPVSRFSRKCSS